ncbi:hypothetical protein ACM39_16860 [Chryseobacterium sp. FH2]|uniref:hypothetical protein n=1 Tax=Chryseobacterium sp. FH2 TaxID=1674291 RepID=UPI00065AAFF3|nr:hypothetical protein [Chryseobacterium sp. FH2]KMQ64195.1 hypothetical protein ACM39_16860 [Chryseobacterium sp. FH2]
MKTLTTAFFFLSCLLFSQTTKAVPDDYKKIPSILDTTDYLYPFIVPDKKFEYWSVLQNNTDPDEAIIYESQMPDFMTVNDPAPEKGFFQKCLGENCFSYIIACENSRSRYFSNEQQLRDFIGFVDNLSEAILVANTYGFTVDTSNKLSSSYKIDGKYIHLYLSKSKDCPITKESFFITINRETGKLESKSNGIYFKNEDCNNLIQ